MQQGGPAEARNLRIVFWPSEQFFIVWKINETNQTKLFREFLDIDGFCSDHKVYFLPPKWFLLCLTFTIWQLTNLSDAGRKKKESDGGPCDKIQVSNPFRPFCCIINYTIHSYECQRLKIELRAFLGTFLNCVCPRTSIGFIQLWDGDVSEEYVCCLLYRTRVFHQLLKIKDVFISEEALFWYEKRSYLRQRIKTLKIWTGLLPLAKRRRKAHMAFWFKKGCVLLGCTWFREL